MPGIIPLLNLKPTVPVTITVSRLAAIRQIETTAKYAPATIADYAARSDVRLVRWTLGNGATGTVDGPLGEANA